MIRSVAAALVAGVLLLSGCTAEPEPEPEPSTTPTATATSASVEPTPAKEAPRPANLACYALGFDEAVAPTSDRPPSSCRKEHTSMTFFVGALDTAVDGHLLAVDSKRVQAQIAEACPRRLSEFVGGSLEDRRLSMIRSVWFTPSVEQSDDGANWFRCDVIAVAADGELAQLKGRMRGVLGSADSRRRYAMCGTAEPGTDGFQRVICSEDHSWRALRTVGFDARRYPGADRVRSAGEDPCQDAGRDAADDALNFKWGYEWPTREQWDAGQTYGLCWAPD